MKNAMRGTKSKMSDKSENGEIKHIQVKYSYKMTNRRNISGRRTCQKSKQIKEKKIKKNKVTNKIK